MKCWTNRGVFPVQDDLRNVLRLLNHGVVAPVFTADSYHTILIHALKKKKKEKKKEEDKKGKILSPLIKQSKKLQWIKWMSEITF